MNLKSYLDLFEVLQNKYVTHKEKRAFGLSHGSLKNQPNTQLLAWCNIHSINIQRPLLSTVLSTYLYGITLTLVLVAFVLGLFSGFALLRYNGHAPVNVVYFMVMVIFFPLFTMMLTLFSMFRARSAQSVLIHISPAFWMEKVLALLPHKTKDILEEKMKTIQLNPLITNWLVIKRSQLIALFFSMGLFFALLGLVATQDIAFAWSTTLQVTPEAFHTLVDTLAFPWKTFFPWAVPSVDLIEHSHYFRLGDRLSPEMVNVASTLGEWWEFLAFSTLFYAIVLRFLIYLLASFGLKKAITISLPRLEGAQDLLQEINEPIISMNSKSAVHIFQSKNSTYKQILEKLDASYDKTLGWAIDKDALRVMNENMQVLSPILNEVGGGNSLDEDREIVYRVQGKVLFYVKAWEPPTMDFIDFLEILLSKADKVIIVPVGTAERFYKSSIREVNIWARKLSTLESEKVWFYGSNVKEEEL